MDYGLAVRTGPASEIWSRFEMLFAVFAMLESPTYTRVMGFQMLMWCYYQDIKHPFLRILDECPANLVGEDIELSLMLLTNFASTTDLTRETDPLHKSFSQLSLLMHVAKKVRDYRVSQFGGATRDRSRLHYTEDSPEAEKTRQFVIQWIDRTAEHGLWEYKKPPKKKSGETRVEKIAVKETAEKSADYVFNVALIDMRWETFARQKMLSHLDTLENTDYGKNFSFDFLLRFRSHYGFDDDALLRVLPDSPDTEDSANDVSLLEFVAKIRSRRSHGEQETKERERLEADAKREAEAKKGPRKRGRPRKKAPPPTVVLAEVKKRKRGRPAGSRNRLKPALARGVRSSQLVAKTPFVDRAAVFDDSDLPYPESYVSSRFFIVV